MNCDHVLGLIDAGPFADYPRAHLEAAWRHAGECATCGSALEASLVLTKELKVLARPAPPRELAPAVMARIARLDEARGSASEADGAAHAADHWSIGT
jgi:hypothetical protein